MKLLPLSFVLGLLFEGLLFLGLVVGLTAGHGCVPDSWMVYTFVAAHYPAVLLEGHIWFPLNVVIAVVLAVAVWTGLIYLILSLAKKLTKKP